MDISSINSDLIRGNVTTIILRSLLDEDRYGYDILKEIEVKSEGQYKLKQPTLYGCLKRLEKNGLIRSYLGEEDNTEGGRRRYYALNDEGRSYLLKMQSEYEYSRTILDKLLSEEAYDFDNKPAPFDINGLRPYTKRKADDEGGESDIVEAVKEAAENIKREDSRAYQDIDELLNDEPTFDNQPKAKDTRSQFQGNVFNFNPHAAPTNVESRTVRRSFDEVINSIEKKLDKKETEQEVEASEEQAPTADAKKKLSIDPDKFSFTNFKPKALEQKDEHLSQDELKRREAAKNALKIGDYADKSAYYERFGIAPPAQAKDVPAENDGEDPA